MPGWLNRNTYYTAFTEGWGLYSENPIISDDTDTYKDSLLQKFGMLKWQVSMSLDPCTSLVWVQVFKVLFAYFFHGGPGERDCSPVGE